MSIDYYQRIIEQFTLDNKPLLLAAGVSNFIGLAQYFVCIRAFLIDGKSPLPFWMHSFYLAHDSAWCYLLSQAAPRYDNHWYLTGLSNGLLVWSIMEIWCIYKIVMEDRKGVFSSFFGPTPSLSQVLCYAFAHLSAMYTIVFLGIVLMGEACVMQWGCLTNVLMAVGPTHEYMRRGSREGLPISFCLLSVAGTLWTFAPFGMWALVLPEIYDQSTYYVSGVVLSLYSVWCCRIVFRYPLQTKVFRD